MPIVERVIPGIGDRITGYELIEEIGRGGFGIVFRARQLGLDADRALKLMLLEGFDEDEKRQLQDRFEQEAQVAKLLEHPCAIKVHDFGRTPEGLPFIVSEFVRGKSLGELLAEQPLSVERTVHVTSQILGCLAEAHHRGIVHRDLKPANIMLRDIFTERDVVKVLDFGIAKVAAEIGGITTKTGQSFGTPHYISPEQARGEKDIDGRADLYSLGLVMAECLTGRRVVAEPDTFAALYAHVRPEPLTFDPFVVQSPLFPVIRHATSKDRSLRYAGAPQMRDALQAVRMTGQRAVHGEPPPNPSSDQHVAARATVPATPGTPLPAGWSNSATQHLSTGRSLAVPADEPDGRDHLKRVPLLVLLALLVAGAVYALVALPSGGDVTADTTANERASRAVEPAETTAGPGQAEPEDERQVAATVAEESEAPPLGAVESSAVGDAEPSPGASAERSPETETSGAGAVPTMPERVIATIEGSPSRADVRIGGERVCTELPCQIELEAGEGSERVSVRASHYHGETLRLSRESSETYRVQLQREDDGEGERVGDEPPSEEPERPALPGVRLDFDD